MDSCVIDKKFYLIEYVSQKGPYIALIVGTTSESPLSYLSDVANELSGRLEKGYVLLDMLLHSGVGNERFIEVEFTGDKFNIESAKVVNLERNNFWRKKGCSILSQQPEIIEYSILNSRQKNLLLHGVCI